MKNKIQPAGIQDVIPYLVVENAGKMIEFIAIVFDADILECSDGKTHQTSNAVMKIGGSILEVADRRSRLPACLGRLRVYVPDVDTVYRRALDAGAVSISAPANLEIVERSAGFRDPFGGEWLLSAPLAG
ncbi:MAG: hypothetical protein AAGU05_01460 [Anaerolineaceae bacterium]